MRRLKLFIAASLDGYIAGPNGEIDWLENAADPADYGYREFYDSIDTTLMGNNTYKLMNILGGSSYSDKTNYVFTRGIAPAATNHFQFISGDIAAFARSLKQQLGKDIWLVGGGQVNTIMLNEGLIDDIILTVFPLVLGEGISLFALGAKRSSFKTLNCRSYETGLIQWHLTKI